MLEEEVDTKHQSPDTPTLPARTIHFIIDFSFTVPSTKSQDLSSIEEVVQSLECKESKGKRDEEIPPSLLIDNPHQGNEGVRGDSKTTTTRRRRENIEMAAHFLLKSLLKNSLSQDARWYLALYSTTYTILPPNQNEDQNNDHLETEDPPPPNPLSDETQRASTLPSYKCMIWRVEGIADGKKGHPRRWTALTKLPLQRISPTLQSLATATESPSSSSSTSVGCCLLTKINVVQIQKVLLKEVGSLCSQILQRNQKLNHHDGKNLPSNNNNSDYKKKPPKILDEYEPQNRLSYLINPTTTTSNCDDGDDNEGGGEDNRKRKKKSLTMDMCKDLNGIQDLLELNPKIPISDCLLFAKGKHLLEKEQQQAKTRSQKQLEEEEETPFNGFLWPQYMEQYRGLEFYHFIKSWFRDYCSNTAAAENDQEEDTTLVNASLPPPPLQENQSATTAAAAAAAAVSGNDNEVGNNIDKNDQVNNERSEKKISPLLITNDGVKRDSSYSQRRKKALLLYGPRCIGKTSFATSLVNHNPKHFILCKNTFNQESFKPAMGDEPTAKLLILDDMNIYFKRDHRETLKSLVTSESCVIREAYMNFHFKHGLPTIINTNDLDVANRLAKDPCFMNSIVYVLVDHYFGPPLEMLSEHDRLINHKNSQFEISSQMLEKLASLNSTKKKKNNGRGGAAKSSSTKKRPLITSFFSSKKATTAAGSEEEEEGRTENNDNEDELLEPPPQLGAPTPRSSSSKKEKEPIDLNLNIDKNLLHCIQEVQKDQDREEGERSMGTLMEEE
jgi:hypothetical protein